MGPNNKKAVEAGSAALAMKFNDYLQKEKITKTDTNRGTSRKLNNV